MIGAVLNKIFGSHSERQMKKVWPLVDQVNAYYEEMEALSDTELQAKTDAFRLRLMQGEALDDMYLEALAVVKQACKRHVGQTWTAAEAPINWVEVPYDVQLIGAITLHSGKIAEMRTGEGKTLVAALSLYVNALEGKGCHLVTTNDFLARRDSEWMGHILEWLGISVGCIRQEMEPTTRRKMYACDVTYGQNSEFGFDYLRDNMTSSAEHLVQGARSHISQQIVDEAMELAREHEATVITDRFQTLMLQGPPAMAPALIERFAQRFSLESIQVRWQAQNPGAPLPPPKDYGAEVSENFNDVAVPEGKCHVRFQFQSRDHHYAIVDEVDSILIDEARTPLIISGQVDRSTHRFEKMRPLVENLVRNQASLATKLLREAEEMLQSNDEDQRYQAGMKLLQVKKAMPKNKRLLKHSAEPDTSRLLQKCENDFILDQKSKMGEKTMNWLEEELFFVIDEKGHSVDLTEKGRESVSPDNPDRFLLADMVDEFALLESDASLSPEQREESKAKIREENEIKSEELHNISQLLRAYSLFEKDVEYVVQDNKVVIVDEFTGHLQPGRRFSDGLHQAIEAKERVKIEKETQTLATITIQNYFRMYDKLAGMTGTAETEAAEFGHTYKMEVVVIPTNRPITRVDEDDSIYRTKREKYTAIINEIAHLHQKKLPVLVGTVSVETSELLSRMLKRAGVSHSVLNAKYHQKEAEIVRNAGLPGAVTIATNMAGRGVDIKLGEGVVRKNAEGQFDTEEPGGLQVIGTERHEARRIDNQLRGRSGRQGDPGRSVFFLSLEDDLMRLFGSDRISSILQKLGIEEGEEIRHSFISRAISKAQKRIEEMNFERRKRTLDYDNVMNKQREAIYGLRREVLISPDLKDIVLDICYDAMSHLANQYRNEGATEGTDTPPYDMPAFEEHLRAVIPGLEIKRDDTDSPEGPYMESLMESIEQAYNLRLEMFGPANTLAIARFIILQTIDNTWRDHLHGIDDLREGIHLRSYAQLDPLVEYQREASVMFQDMMSSIQRAVLEHFFRVSIAREQNEPRGNVDYGRGAMEPVNAETNEAVPVGAGAAAQQGRSDQPARPQTYTREEPKVGRNDPCPCGSGKKYKKCCGRSA